LENREKSDALKIPYSGQIIGTVVDALEIQTGVLANRTAKRYYSGHMPCQYNQKEIFRAFGQTLVDLGIVPVPPGFQKYHISMSRLIANMTWQFARKWDNLCSIIQNRSTPIQNPAPVIYGFCRLVVVDFSLRLFALFRLTEMAVPESHLPTWAMENGGGKLLRILIDQTNLSRDQFGAKIGVSPTSMDNWLDGKTRPTRSHIRDIAIELGRIKRENNEDVLFLQMYRQFSFAYLADILANRVGRENVVELGTALMRFMRLIADDVNQQQRPPIEEVAGLEFNTLRYGVDEPLSHTLLNNLAMVEKDQNWKRDILASAFDWSLRFQEIMNLSSPRRSSAGLAEEIADDPAVEAEIEKLKESSVLTADDYRRIHQGDPGLLLKVLNIGLDDYRLIVKRYPLSPKAHFLLGSQLGLNGKWLNNRQIISDAINECKIAASLHEGWDAPLVEIGIMLANVGRYEEGLAELEAAEKRLGRVPPHLAFCRGYCLMALDKYADALKNFEIVIGSSPDYAVALDHAAHCAFSLHDNQKGMDYAKRAFILGAPEAYNDWRNGKYKK
jgi:transcriptional regulator with XRE-family HTH domain